MHGKFVAWNTGTDDFNEDGNDCSLNLLTILFFVIAIANVSTEVEEAEKLKQSHRRRKLTRLFLLKH